MAIHTRQKDRNVRVCACWCKCRNKTARMRQRVGYVLCRPCRYGIISGNHGVSSRRAA